ncbi:MAG TPA: sulfatase-like hydrolase/transferase, partial [Polyangiaceae bacterium]|nr:sulfatase-like hydrolase/transferase [Polyangiaceae bacterium]
ESSEFPPLPFLEGTLVKNPDMQPDDQRELTSELTNYAVDFIERHQEEPFLLYLAHPKPHVPLYVSKQFEGASGEGLFADVMMEIDWSVGEVVRALDEAQLTETTWIVFASDNGPWLTYGNHAGRAAPFREGKFTTFEGGTRVPLVMRFPGYIPAGATNSSTFMNIDILPTFAALVGAEFPVAPIDGQDIWNTLVDGEHSPQEAYYLWNGEELEAVLTDKWKLHLPHAYQTVAASGADGKRGTTELAELPLSLFELARDPGETKNVASEHPELVRELSDLAFAHQAELRSHQREPGRL